MKSSIKVIKHNREKDAKDAKEAPVEKSVKRSTREMVTTVKGWIAELEQRKREMNRSFVRLPIAVTERSHNS